MAKKDYEEKYTHPEMREEIIEEIKASSKGGEEGEWSTRKSQLLSREYEKRGGGYKARYQDTLASGLQGRGQKPGSEEPPEVDRGGVADS